MGIIEGKANQGKSKRKENNTNTKEDHEDNKHREKISMVR